MNAKLLFSVSCFVVMCVTINFSWKMLLVNINARTISQYHSLRQFFKSVNSSLQLPLIARSSKRLVFDVNCEAIIKGDPVEIKKAEDKMNSNNFSRKGIADKIYIELTKDCDNFTGKRYPYGYSDEEVGFSVAYSILLYKDVEQAERLLRAIYSPQNYYCIHVDADAEKDVHNAIDGIANCLQNVFVATRKEYVVYAGFTRLQADITCMENLLERGKEWKYFINLPSQEFPLKTNAEIATILRIYNGSNDIEGLTGNRRLMGRYKHRFIYRYTDINRVKPNIVETNQTTYNPPFDIEVVKGSAYGIFSRDFVHFVTFDKKARAILDWFRDVLSPDEYYWATLNYNHHIGVPGSFYRGMPDDKPWLAVFANWGEEECHGKSVHGICIFGVGDLHKLVIKPHLFANKFFINYQPYALDCIEEWHFNRSTRGIQYLNTTYYKSLPFIKRSPDNTTF